MNRRFLMFGILLSILPAAALAQTPDAGDGTRIPIYSEPVYITVPSDEPLALWVRDVKGDTATAVVLVQTPDGWTQMTPCDNAEVPCKDVQVAAEGTQQGDTFYLASE